MNDVIWQIFILHFFLLMSLLENATSPWGQSWSQHLCLWHLCLCKALSQDCPHGEIRHTLVAAFFKAHIKVVFLLTIYSIGLGKGVKEDVERNIIYGPKRYVPQPNEWIHQFKWHGTDSKDKARKVPGATNFQLLRVIADKLYYNVTDVRTRDDTLVKVKLMIFFELEVKLVS